MGLITSAGIGSGLDVETIIDALVDAETSQKSVQFDRKEALTLATISGIGSLKSALSELKSSLFNLNSSVAFQQRSATSSDKDVATISADVGSTPGTFDLTVNQIAKGSKAETGTFGAATDTVGSGVLTLGAGTESFSITIDAGDSLTDIANAINSASNNFGVNANIINGDSGTILTFTSSVTGLTNDITITNNDASLDAISTVANAGGAGGTSVTSNAASGQISIEGQTITSETNVYEDAVQGTTITVNEDAEIASTATLSVALDKSSVKKNIESFVKTYNAFIGVANELQNPDQNQPGVLLGDSTLRTVLNQLRSTISTEVSGVNTTYNSFARLGVRTNQNGTLEIDSATLDNALDDSFENIGDVFASDNGLANVLSDRINEYTSATGILSSRTDTLNNQLERIEEGRKALSFRGQQLETTLRAKFGAMDLIVAQLNSTGSFLTQQLSNLPGFYSSKKS